MRLVQAASILFPNDIVIPTDSAGGSRFDLSSVAQANGFNSHNSHGALSDAQAVVYLCKLLMQRTPDLWSTFVRFSHKAAVVDYIANETVFSLSDVYFGIPYSWYVTALGANTNNNSEYYVYDLSIDPGNLAGLTDDALASRLRQPPKPVRRLKCNGAPIVMPLDDAPQIAIRMSPGLNEIERRAENIHSDAQFRARLVSVFESLQGVREPSAHVEEQIYDRFTSFSDQELLDTFHRVPWEERLELLEGLEDARIFQLGQQLCFFERPDLLEERTRNKIEGHLSERLMRSTDDPPWLTLPHAIEQLDNLIRKADDSDREFLLSHKTYLSHRIEDGPLNVFIAK